MEFNSDKYNVNVPARISSGKMAEQIVSQLLEADNNRLKYYEENFDPITGDGAPPMPRFNFDIDELHWQLPVAMRGIEMIRELIKHGSIAQFCKRKKMQGHEDHIKWMLALTRCKHDFCFWAATCCTVKDKRSGRNIKFRLNWPQRKCLTELEKMRLENRPIRMIILKARQWGGSTLVQMYMAWIQLMLIEGRNSAIVAHLNQSSLNIRAMYKRMIDAYPPEMLGLDHNAKLQLSPFNASRTDYTIKNLAAGREQVRNMLISVGSMQTPDSIRGSDIALVHFSEVGVWKKTENRTPEEVIQGTQSAVIAEPLTMVVMESTAKGEGNLFHHEWLDAKSGASDKVPLFVAWYEIEIYRREFSNDEERKNFARWLLTNRHQEYITNSRAEPGSYLWRLWAMGATLEGIYWYIEQRKAYRDHDTMASEFPSDDIEAFAHSGTPVFDPDRVEELRRDCMPPVHVGEVRGRGVDDETALQDIKFFDERGGSLRVWKMPDDSFAHRNRYIVSVDIGGRGSRADWSVIVVIDRWARTENGLDEIVAEWHGHIRHDLLAWKMAQIAAFYCNALLVVESNTFETRNPLTEGIHSDYILDQIGMAYRNLYTREAAPDNVRKGRPGRKWGFQTNTRTKPLIIDSLTRSIEEHLYIEREEEVLTEYRVYQRTADGKTNAADGYHDDRVMARAIGLYISNSLMPRPAKVDPLKFTRMRRSRKHPPSEANF